MSSHTPSNKLSLVVGSSNREPIPFDCAKPCSKQSTISVKAGEIYFSSIKIKIKIIELNIQYESVELCTFIRLKVLTKPE